MNKILNKIYIVEMLLILLLIIYAIFSVLETNNLNKELEILNDKIDNINEEIETYVSEFNNEISDLEDKILELQGQINSNRSRIKELEYITSEDYVLGDYVYTSAIIYEIEVYGSGFIYLIETIEYGVGVVYSEDIYNINDIVLVGLHYNLPPFIVGKIG